MTTNPGRPGRRRFIRIAASAAGLGWQAAHAAPEHARMLHTWRGVALGADASLQLYHPDEREAERLTAVCLDEVSRLEKIFSLYRQDSAIRRLNHGGRLDQPPMELVELLSLSRHIAQLTGGAFDPTVQPLWELYAAHFAKPNADPAGPSPASLEDALGRVGVSGIEIEPNGIRFLKPNMGITLNGIAQGYVTDRVVDLLRSNGLQHVLADMGEIRALGTRPHGDPWSVGLEDPVFPGQVAHRLFLVDKAVSTSGGYGFHFDAAGRFNHIFDPSTGGTSENFLSVSVVTKTATFADGLSTAFSVMPLARIREVAKTAGAKIFLRMSDGSDVIIDG
ncbi:FAD:protein FMN transferase [Enhydrobacter sp.]|uniref:FAD:protein FMN transferase n=1 Tax=Enhydrobacter sp. TaxID=1894999 RepID=UPI002621E4E2|nr:FAD:protein FMN transferase [Enhydrobacter sp.]